jgi:hypothetical protein
VAGLRGHGAGGEQELSTIHGGSVARGANRRPS